MLLSLKNNPRKFLKLWKSLGLKIQTPMDLFLASYYPR